jgi:hypothetical protein
MIQTICVNCKFHEYEKEGKTHYCRASMTKQMDFVTCEIVDGTEDKYSCSFMNPSGTCKKYEYA